MKRRRTGGRSLEGMIFSYAGKLENRYPELNKIVESNGGKYRNYVTDDVTHVITTRQVYEERTLRRMRKCLDLEDVTIVTEDFLFASLERNSDPNAHVLRASRSALANVSPTKRRNIESADSGATATVTTSTAVPLSSTVEGDRRRTFMGRNFVTGSAEPDRIYPFGAEFAVHRRGINVYSVTLVNTSVSYGSRGHNKFYVIQLLQKTGQTDRFHLFTRWGRVGSDGVFKVDDIRSEKDAIEHFESKFYSKTGNRWINRHGFQHVQGKYIPVYLDNKPEELEDEVEKLYQRQLTAQRTMISGLSLRHERLLNLIFDVSSARSALYDFQIDATKFPLGRLTTEQLRRGYDTIEKIERIVRRSPRHRRRAPAEIANLSSLFYATIPQDVGYKRPEPIDNLSKIAEKYDLLNTLSDLEVCIEITRANDENGLNPLKAKYTSLNNKITPVRTDAAEYEAIRKYFENTVGDTRIQLVDILATQRIPEDSRPTGVASKYLWHGSRVSSFPAILSKGLRVMPHSGGRLGKGIYFSDAVHTSQIYCGIWKENAIGLLLLCEVALGTQHEVLDEQQELEKPPVGYDSVVGVGVCGPNPAEEIDFQGSRMPQGKLKKKRIQSAFLDNEYVIYDETKVQMRYIVMAKW